MLTHESPSITRPDKADLWKRHAEACRNLHEACNLVRETMTKIQEQERAEIAERLSPLDDVEIDRIAESMPGGMDGFLKGWGWRQFARAIEAAHGIGDA